MFPGGRLLLAGAALLAAVSARAQDGTELFAPETVTLVGDARIVGADGEPSWLDGAFGKTRFAQLQRMSSSHSAITVRVLPAPVAITTRALR